MAPHNKLLMTGFAGATMVARTVEAALHSQACGVWVVIGHQAEEVSAALAGRDVHLVHARDYAGGLASSLGSGIAALPAEVGAAVVCLGDMPLVRPADIDKIIDGYDPAAGRLIVVPVRDGQRGNPVLWDRRFFPEILALKGDRGARSLLGPHARQVYEVAAASEAVLRDFDTQESLAERH